MMTAAALRWWRSPSRLRLFAFPASFGEARPSRSAKAARLPAGRAEARRDNSWVSSQADRDAVLAEMRLQAADAGFGVVKDRGGERGVGAAGGEDLDEVVEAAGAARRDHRDRHRRRDRCGERAVEAGLGA